MRFGLLLGFLLVPTYAFAAGFLGQIVPACTEGGDGICQACNLVQLAQNILRAMVTLSAFAASIMFAYAGFLYVTAASSHANIESARKTFWNVLIGIIVVLTAYLIVDLALKVFTGQPLNVLSRIQCVQGIRATGANAGVTVDYKPIPDAPDVSGAGGGTAAKDGEGLANVDGNTNYNPVACKLIANYNKTGPGASCTPTATAASAQVANECMQGCMGSANGKRIITVADYKQCQTNSSGSLSPITQSGNWGNFAAMPCSQVLTNGVTVATPQNSGIPRGQKFTWPELAVRYGLPPETVFTANDSYGVQCGALKCGNTTRGTYTVDVARCITGQTACNSLPSYGGSVPIPTRPTPIPGS